MTLSSAINLGVAAPNLLNPAGTMAAVAQVSLTVDRMTTTVDSTNRTVDRS